MAAFWAVFTFGGSGPALTTHGSLDLKQEIQIQIQTALVSTVGYTQHLFRTTVGYTQNLFLLWAIHSTCFYYGLYTALVSTVGYTQHLFLLWAIHVVTHNCVMVCLLVSDQL
jgi:hypothetical protein